MDMPYIIVILALVTMLIVLIYAIVGKTQIEARRKDPESPKSTLAKDKASDGKPVDV